MDVIINTAARRFRTEPGLLEDLRGVARDSARFYLTESLADLDRVAHDLATRGSDLVVLAGGDGTFMSGVTALTRAFGGQNLPKVALFPGGTVATVARNFGMRGSPQELFARLLAGPDSLVFCDRPTLRVVGDDGPERVGFIFGTGLVASFFDVYYAAGGQGYAGAARIVARVFAESFIGGAYAKRVLSPLPCTLEVEGERLAPEAWSLIVAAVVPDLGIHMRVTYRAGEDPERPHLVASCLGPSSLGPRMPLVLAGKRIGGAGHVDQLARSFAVHFGDRPGPYVLDGEILHAQTVRVSAGPVVKIVDLSVDQEPTLVAVATTG